MGNSELRLKAFGSPCRVVVHSSEGRGEELLQLARDEISRLEMKFCSFEQDSIVSRINQTAGTGSYTPLDAESRSLLNYVTALWTKSSHLFDPTVRALQNCYHSDGHRLATDEQLRKMLTLVGWSQLKISADGAYLSGNGMLIDLNSCIRPYAIDSAIKILAKNSASHALIEMDQDTATLGKQPDGSNWLIGVRFPRGSRTAISRIKLNQKGFAIRGDFERATRQDEERFGRALSPVDGLPVPGLLSVAVIADSCLTACSAASIARMKTEKAAIKWLEDLGLPWMAIDRQLHSHGPLAPQH